MMSFKTDRLVVREYGARRSCKGLDWARLIGHALLFKSTTSRGRLSESKWRKITTILNYPDPKIKKQDYDIHFSNRGIIFENLGEPNKTHLSYLSWRSIACMTVLG